MRSSAPGGAASSASPRGGVPGIGRARGSSSALFTSWGVPVSATQPVIPHDACAIFLRQGEALTAEVWRGTFGQAAPPAIRLGQGITGWGAETGTPPLVKTAEEDP